MSKNNKILIFNVTSIDNRIYLDLYCIGDSFSRFGLYNEIIRHNAVNLSKSCELLYQAKIDISEINQDRYISNINLISDEIKNILNSLDIKKAFNILNYSSDKLFLESISFPKLNEKKIIEVSNFKLNKLYYNFDEFYYRCIGRTSISFFEKNDYERILKLFNDLNIGINYVSLNYLGISELFKNYHYLNIKDNSIFINLKKNYSQVYIYEGLTLVGTRIINVGYETLIKGEDSNIDLKKELDLLIYYFNKINNIYFNTEDEIDLDISYLLTEYEDIKVKKLSMIKSNILNNLSSYGGMIYYLKRLDNEYAYNFPMRVKCNN